MRDTKQKDPNPYCRANIPGSPQVASDIGRFRDVVRQHMAPELIIPAVGVHIIAVVAIFAVTTRDVPALVTQSHVVVAVVLATSEQPRSTFLPLVRGEATQLSESWDLVSQVADACQCHNVRFWFLVATLPLDVSSSRWWYSMMNFLTRLILTFR